MGKTFSVRKEGRGKWRLDVEGGGIAMSKNGRPLDGGGHKRKRDAERQKDHIHEWYEPSGPGYR